MGGTDVGEMKSSMDNGGWGECRVRFARGWKRRTEENERRTVQVAGGELCVGEE